MDDPQPHDENNNAFLEPLLEFVYLSATVITSPTVIGVLLIYLLLIILNQMFSHPLAT